jgi:hypothetical protein
MKAMLKLPTGRLIAADPSVLYGDARPLAAGLPPGEFTVASGPETVEIRVYSPAAGSEPGSDAQSEAQPSRWERRPGFPTPSGRLALLDAQALEEFTDLGDEPVDEYELLAERLADSPGGPVEFGGLLVVPCPAGVGAVRLGYAASGRLVCVIMERGVTQGENETKVAIA